MTERASRLGIGPAEVRNLPVDVLPGLLAEALAIQAAVLARMMAPAPVESRPSERAKDRLLTMAEAGERARKSTRWIRDHWRTEMPFAVRKGKTVLFPEAEFEKWLRRT